MFPLTRLAHLFFVLGSLFLAVSVQAGEPPPPNLAGKTQFSSCMSGYLNYSEPSAYFTPVFEVHVPQNAKPSYPEDLAKIYAGFLNQKHGYVRTGSMPVVCSFSVAAAAVEGGKAEVIKDTEYRQRRAVETGWKPSPAQILAAASSSAAPTAPAAPQANSPLTVHGYCKTDAAGAKVYFSKVFDSSIEHASGQLSADQLRPTTDAWRKSFLSFLAQHYGYQGSAECFGGEELNPIQWTWGRLHGLALGRSVDTDWSPGG